MTAPTNFQTIPGQGELADVPRDLSFHPAITTAPKVLTQEQVARFNRDGYLMPLRVFDPDEVAELRRYFDSLLAHYLSQGKDSYSISSAHLRHGRVWDVLTNPRIVAVVTDLVGTDAVAWGSHFFCKMPHDGKTVSWHQDASYWPLTPSKAVTVWCAIDDADRGNACMKYIPGSHRHGHLTYKMSETDENNVLDQTVVGAEGIGEPVYVELKAGEASVHSDLLLHGSEANTSDRRRCGLTLRYTASDVRAYLGWHEKGVCVAGRPADHWADRGRPEGE